MPQKESVLSKREEDMSIREPLGIKHEELASFCGFSKSHVAMIETTNAHGLWEKANRM